jgi:hypothetical protein
MVSLRWIAACTLSFALIAGCQSNTKAPPPAVMDGPPTPEKVAAAKAAYAAMPGVLVGEVELVRDDLAAVSGIDAKSVTKDDTFSFIDVVANRVINTGQLEETKPNRLIIKASVAGDRLPREGDLCVKLK